MQSSNLQMWAWALAVYLMTTGIEGTASMKLHRDLGVTQKTAWHLAHRIRESWDDQGRAQYFEGPVELDESYFGGKEKNSTNRSASGAAAAPWARRPSPAPRTERLTRPRSGRTPVCLRHAALLATVPGDRRPRA